MKWISKKFTTIFTFTSRHPGKSWNGVDRKFDKKVLIKIISLYLLNHIDMATRTLPIHHFSLDSFMQQVFYWQKLFSTSHPLFWSEKTQNRHRTSKRWWHFSFFWSTFPYKVRVKNKIRKNNAGFFLTYALRQLSPCLCGANVKKKKKS